MLFDAVCCSSYEQTGEAIDAVADYLHKAEPDHFPVPGDVVDLVNGVIRAVFGVLVRHNHVTDALLVLSEGLEGGRTLARDTAQYADVLKSWRAAHRSVLMLVPSTANAHCPKAVFRYVVRSEREKGC